MSAGLVMIEPMDLYNLLNQTWLKSPCVSDENYLLLLDLRLGREYMESHVITAKHVPWGDGNQSLMLKDLEVETKTNVVLYDNRTRSTKDPTSPTVCCGNLLWEIGSKYPVQILKGGFEEFSALYPFLRTQKIMFTPREIHAIKVYPVEVIPGYLYLGTFTQAGDDSINKHLKVKAHVNVTTRLTTRYSVDDVIDGKDGVASPALLNIPIDDDCNADLFSYLPIAASFIACHQTGDGRSVLVYSDLGLSRCAAVVIAHIMYSEKKTLRESWSVVKSCHNRILPNSGFMEQLSRWEEQVLGRKVTNITNMYAWT